MISKIINCSALKIIRFIVIIFLLSSCARFSYKTGKKDRIKLSQESISIISGIYKLYPFKEYSYLGKHKLVDDKNYRNNAFGLLNDNKFEFNDTLDYYFEIKVENDTSIVIILREGLTPITNFRVFGKCKKNGFFYLNDEYIDFHNIPYILGGVENYKTRIGITRDKDLIIHRAYNNTGAFLFIFGTGLSGDDAFSYKRIIDSDLIDNKKK